MLSTLALVVAAHAVVPTAPGADEARIKLESPQPAPRPLRAPAGLMLEPGLFHGGDLPIHDPARAPASGWMALVQAEAGLELVPATVVLRRAEDPLVDVPGDPPSGIEVSVTTPERPLAEDELPPTPLLLLHGLPLTAGPITTTYSGSRHLEPGVTQHVSVGPDAISRLVVADADGLTDPARVDPQGGLARLLLERTEATEASSRIQEIATVEGPDADGGPYLLWAGDLDSDGRADLLIEIDAEFNRSRTALFLSSLAREGELVGLAAVLDTTGC